MIYYRDTLKQAGPEDIERIKGILEDPSVAGNFGSLTVKGKPWEGAFEDLAWFIFPGGVFAVEVRSDWSAWVHVAVLPWARGKPAMTAARALLDWFFKNTPCTRIAGWTPENLANARLWNLMLGFTPRMRRKGRVLYVLARDEYQKVVTL